MLYFQHTPMSQSKSGVYACHSLSHAPTTQPRDNPRNHHRARENDSYISGPLGKLGRCLLHNVAYYC